jgi:putative flavoprotein involved in K+ transport
MTRVDIVIVGGGQAGLAAAYAARRAGLSPTLLEAGPEPVGSWPRYYDSLTLFSPARYSELPGRRFGGDRDRYPTRDEVVDYLRAYAAALDADIRCHERVERVGSDADSLLVESASGLSLRSRLVIAATGSFGAPHRPALPGLDRFAGTVIHASEYRDPRAFADRRALVVGGGNSAVQIAAELARVAHVTLTTRSPLNFNPQRPLGRDLHWWLTRSGLDSAPIGGWLRGRTTPVLDDGRYRAAIAAGRPDHRPLLEQLDGHDVVWSDGEREPVDAVILATGYRPHLPYLAGTGALNVDGEPLHRAGVSTAIRGLGYVGLEYQRSIASATLRGGARDAARVIRRLQRAAARGTADPAYRIRNRRVTHAASRPSEPAL